MSDKTLKNKSIKVKGNADYTMVKDRVLWLDKNKAGEYSIKTKHWYYPEQRTWVVKARLLVDSQEYNGHAQEVESDDPKLVNFASALENCETSAIGRACAAYGLGIEESYASGDEIQKAQNRGSNFNAKPPSDKQLKWIRDTAYTVNDQLGGSDEEVDAWIEKEVGIKITEMPSWKTKEVVDKLKTPAKGAIGWLDKENVPY